VQFVCILEPFHLRLLALAVLLAGVAAGCSVAVAAKRWHVRQGAHLLPTLTFHVAILGVVITYIVAAGVYFPASLHMASNFEHPSSEVVDAVRSAAATHLKVHAGIVLLALTVFSWSVLLWRRVLHYQQAESQR
jgi:uncharacterized membrane protein YciS (DUF1049 family)